MADIDNLKGGTKRVVEETEPLNNLRGGTKRVVIVDGGGGSSLPDQTGNAGKFLTTDGTDASWSDKPLVNNTTRTSSLALLGTATGNYSVVIGDGASSSSSSGTVVGYNAKTTAVRAIQLGSGTNSDANTFKVGNANGNFEIMSADGTIPTARLADTTSAQQGDVLTLDSNGDAVWQAGGGGGLPTQTGNAGKFLTTDGTDASWGTELTDALVIRRSGATDNCLILYNGAFYGSIYMQNASSSFYFSRGLKVGGNVLPSFSGYELGSSSLKWVLYTTKINNGADIAVPTTAGTMVVATPPTTPNTTWVLKATVDANGDYSVAWVQEV